MSASSPKRTFLFELFERPVCAAMREPDRAAKRPFAGAGTGAKNFFQKAWNNFAARGLSRLG
jgi:hypothetical protein